MRDATRVERNRRHSHEFNIGDLFQRQGSQRWNRAESHEATTRLKLRHGSSKEWDAIKGAKILPDSAEEDGIEKGRELPDEDDDNAYQDSDDALPDDAEEAAIKRDPARRGGPFDEV